MASSGSTGRPSVYVYARADSTGILAMFFGYNETVGAPRLCIAALGAPTLAGMTQQIAAGVDVGLHRVLRLLCRRAL